MKKGDREKVQELILQAIREWHELSTDVSITSYIAEWLLQNDLAFAVRCEDCKYRVLDTVNGEDWCNHTLGLCSEVYATDFCCHGERKDND